ncbi:MAG: UrcA family protein [Rhodanobacteraceae bacterium]
MLHPEFSHYALIGAVATLMVALTPAAALAGDAMLMKKSVTVRVADLNPSRAADAAALYARIRNAAADACSEGFTAFAADGSTPDRDCIVTAVAVAVDSLKSPLVTAIHQRTVGPAVGRAGM